METERQERRAVATYLLWLAGILIVAGVLTFGADHRTDVYGTHRAPRCAAEDSCTLDYCDGVWWIEGVAVTVGYPTDRCPAIP